MEKSMDPFFVMSQLDLKPTHAAVKNYYAALNQFGQLYIDHEMAVRSAFQYLLSTSGRKLKLTLVPEFEIKRKNSSIRVDGALIDEFHLSHGYWEAKDEKDDLDRKGEVAEKHGLLLVDGQIPVPDLRVEYETPDLELRHVDLELATREGFLCGATTAMGRPVVELLQ